MNKPHTLPILAFAVCLLAGLWLGARLQPVNLHPEHVSHLIPTLSNNQRTLLLIGIDSRQPARPLGIWELIYQSNSSGLILMPIYPPIPGADQQKNQALLEAFRLTANRQLDPQFIAALHAQNYAWSGYLVMDEQAMDGLWRAFNDPTSITITRQPTHFPLPWEDAEAALVFQTSMLTAICERVPELRASPNLIAIYDQISPHLATDLDLVRAIIEWEALLKRGRGNPCKFPWLPNQAASADIP
jgi:hypothetical protein